MPDQHTIADLRKSYQVACRRPGHLEAWTFKNVPQLFDRLEDCPGFVVGEHPAPGLWLMFAPGGAATLVEFGPGVDSAQHITPDRVFYGPLPKPAGIDAR